MKAIGRLGCLLALTWAFVGCENASTDMQVQNRTHAPKIIVPLEEEIPNELLPPARTPTKGTTKDYWYEVDEGKVSLTKYTGSNSVVTVPSMINGLPVIEIGSKAFMGCTNLSSVTIGNGISTVQSFAFYECERLTSVTIPNSVTYINDGFMYCPSLTAFTVGAGNPVYSSIDGVLFNSSRGTLVQYPSSKHGSVVVVPGFVNGSPVTSIGDGAFRGCTNLTTVTIPNTVTRIGREAFRNCHNLNSMMIPKSVTDIEYNAFLFCPRLTEFTVDAENPTYSSLEGVLFNKSQNLLIQCPQGKAGDYIIPESVTKIEDNSALRWCWQLASVTIPRSFVADIDWLTFLDCASLKTFVVAADNAAFSSVDGVLFNKSQTELIRCPPGKVGEYKIPDGVTNMGTFKYCRRLTKVTIPSSVTNVINTAFEECTNLTSISVDVRNTIYSSEDGVLYNRGQTVLLRCPEGKSGAFTIPNCVTNFGYDAFRRCLRLTSVTIPDGVTHIDNGVFSGCSSLTNVVVGGDVTNINKYAFYSCYGLASILFRGNAPSLDGNELTGVGEVTIYYLPGTTGWGNTFGGRPTAVWNSPTQ